jgi:hypothetical protein
MPHISVPVSRHLESLTAAGRVVLGYGAPSKAGVLLRDLRAARPDVVLVLTWDIVDEVVDQLAADGGWGATYVIPLPEPHAVRR